MCDAISPTASVYGSENEKVGLGVALLTINSNEPLPEFLLLIPTHLASADFAHSLTSQGRDASSRRHRGRTCWVRSTDCSLAISGLSVPELAETSGEIDSDQQVSETLISTMK